jgi:hypothetical protein
VSPRALQRALWLGLAALVALVLASRGSVGVTWDEIFQREYGERVLAWFQSGFRDQGALTYSDLYLYGGLFDLLAQLCVRVSPLGAYETRHVLTGLCAVLGVAGSYRVAARVGGPRAGLYAACLLVLTPPWFGHALFNPKDIPFAAGAIWALDASVLLALGPTPPRLRSVLYAGLSTGIALAVRPGGMFLFAYPFIGVAIGLARAVRARAPLAYGRLAPTLLLRGALFMALAWALMVSTWPWAQLAPFSRPLEAMRVAASFAWDGEVLFGGELIHATRLPRSYLPVWFALTLPELHYWAALIGVTSVALALRARDVSEEIWVGSAAIAVGVVLPLGAALMLRPVIYDAQRHFLFLLPPWAALLGLGLASLHAPGRSPRMRRAALAVAAALACAVVVDLVRLHPYEYVYFNRISGGLRAAAGRYELDYWGVSYKDGLAWVLRKLAPTKGRRPLRVAGCDRDANTRLAYYVEQWPGAAERVQIVRDYARADVYLALPRFHCDEVPGEVLHTVKRQGVPLMYVVRAQH